MKNYIAGRDGMTFFVVLRSSVRYLSVPVAATLSVKVPSQEWRSEGVSPIDEAKAPRSPWFICYCCLTKTMIK